MIGKLIFKLPEERGEFEMAQKAQAYAAACEELDNWLRERIKYHNVYNIQIQEVRDYLHSTLENRGVKIWD